MSVKFTSKRSNYNIPRDKLALEHSSTILFYEASLWINGILFYTHNELFQKYHMKSESRKSKISLIENLIMVCNKQWKIK